MIKRKSVGTIVFRKHGSERLFLLLHYDSGHWDYPKGGVEKGETEEETALRELKEETGLTDARILPVFRETLSYFFREGKELVRKEVVFFIAETREEKITLSFEHKGSEWLPFKEALGKLTYENAREILKKAKAFLEGKAAG